MNQWVQSVCREKEIPDWETIQGRLLVSGSHRLAVSGVGSDIDTICMTPKFVTKEDFFKEDALGLVGLLQARPEVSHVLAIPTAAVPIIEVVWSGIELDVLLACVQLPGNAQQPLPTQEELLDDKILLGVDDATAKSLNGPRVTELIIKLVPNYTPLQAGLEGSEVLGQEEGYLLQ